jgi:hypothetical protein
MKIRSTEREHKFTKQLFSELNIFSIQGLTLSAEQRFTACIEAIQYEDTEEIHLNSIFPVIDVKAKYYLANAIGIPFYYVIYQKQNYLIYEVTCIPEPMFKKVNDLDEKKFIEWWRKIKGQKQTKDVFESKPRINTSIFDMALFKNGLAWGGNVDGYLFKEKKVDCIIENIYTQRNPLNSPKGDPYFYFKGKGPNYNTWMPTVKLASDLKIPLFLFTFDGNSEEEKIGFAVIEFLSSEEVHYLNKVFPHKNIIEGKVKIKDMILSKLNCAPPYFK